VDRVSLGVAPALHPQIELCDRGGGGGSVWIRAGASPDRGEIPWHSCVPYPWPDLANVNPRPIYALPLPPPEVLEGGFAALIHLSLVGLLLGRLPLALRSLPSLKTLLLRGNLLRDLPSWLPEISLSTLDLSDSGLPASFIEGGGDGTSSAATAGEGGPLPSASLRDLRMSEMQSVHKQQSAVAA